MIRLTVSGLDAATARLVAAAKQVPFAASRALNDVAGQIVTVERGVMRSVFDRPTAYTLNALRIEPATKRSLVATVLAKDSEGAERSAGNWLAPEAFGGVRRLKAFERSLQAAGVLPAGMAVVPAAGARLDAFGNWSRAHMNAVLVSMRLAGTAVAARRIDRLKAKDAARKRALPTRYFVVREQQGELEPGIYERKGTRFGEGVRPVVIFTKSVPVYRRRFPFVEVAQRVANKQLGPTFDRMLAEALATAR